MNLVSRKIEETAGLRFSATFLQYPSEAPGSRRGRQDEVHTKTKAAAAKDVLNERKITTETVIKSRTNRLPRQVCYVHDIRVASSSG